VIRLWIKQEGHSVGFNSAIVLCPSYPHEVLVAKDNNTNSVLVKNHVLQEGDLVFKLNKNVGSAWIICWVMTLKFALLKLRGDIQRLSRRKTNPV